MIQHRNHSDLPLVSLQVMTHSGDLSLLHRAAASIKTQDLDHNLIEIQVVFDGSPTDEEWTNMEDAFKECKDFWAVNFVGGDQKNGYYCVARNRALPALRGFYISFMDADNEFAPNHLSGLLAAIRIPHPEQGLPYFVYSRREYVHDKGCDPKLPKGPSPLKPWNPENTRQIAQAPVANFVDTGDMLIAKSALYRLADVTGCVWNSQLRRYGDWDLVLRLANSGFKGMAVDQVTNIYHWTGQNLQTTRKHISDYDVISIQAYEKLKKEGLIRL